MPAACTIPGFMFDTLPTKHTLVESNGKGNVDLFLLEVAAFLGRCPCKVRSSYTVMMPMWLIGHKYSTHPLDFRSMLCSAKPAWDFTQYRGSKDQAGSAFRMALVFIMLFRPSTRKAWSCQVFMHMCTWHNSIYHPWLLSLCPFKPLCHLLPFPVGWNVLCQQPWGQQRELGLNGQLGKHCWRAATLHNAGERRGAVGRAE